MSRILVCDSFHPEGIAILSQVGEVDFRPGLSHDQLHTIINQYQALIIGSHYPLDHELLEDGFNLRAVGCLGQHLDTIDVTSARAMGIEIRNSPGSNAVAIAEHTLLQMLLLARNLNRGLAGKTLGIIGFGLIGRQVAQRALAFGMRVIANQPRLTPELALDEGVGDTDLVDLLHEADFVTLHVPFKAETKALIGQAELAQMRTGSCLINTGHTDLVDDKALLAALNSGQIAGAALPAFPAGNPPAQTASLLVRQHPNVLVAPHVTTILGDRQRDMAVTLARQIADILRVKRPSESLSLEVVPTNQVLPHEQIDDKRVARLMNSLESEGRLVNPPVVTFWHGKYVVLDGATRSTAMKRLGYPYMIVQVVDAKRDNYELHTWYHVISASRPGTELFAHLQTIPGLTLRPLPAEQIQTAFNQPEALCYFLDSDGQATLAMAAAGQDRLQVMNDLVASYTAWGNVERTLLTDLPRLRSQFPQMVAIAIFPQFSPETVFTVASEGQLLPAGLTRFVIPGRILRLNANLSDLKRDEPLAIKRAWFNQFLEEKLARSRLRYYQEPVILLDD